MIMICMLTRSTLSQSKNNSNYSRMSHNYVFHSFSFINFSMNSIKKPIVDTIWNILFQNSKITYIGKMNFLIVKKSCLMDQNLSFENYLYGNTMLSLASYKFSFINILKVCSIKNNEILRRRS